MLSTDSLEALTPEQLATLEELREQWKRIGLSTAPADRPQAEQGLFKAYKAAGLNLPPIVIWLKSARAGATAVRLLKSELDWPHQLDDLQRSVWDEVWQQSVRQIEKTMGAERWQEIRRRLRQEANRQIMEKYGQLVEKRVKEVFAERMGVWVWKYLRQAMGKSTYDQIRHQVEQDVKESLAKRISEKLKSEVFHELVPPIRQQIWGTIAEPLRQMMTINNGVLVGRQTWECGFGHLDSSWVAYYDFFRSIGIDCLKPLSGMTTLAKTCGWWWPYQGLAILTDRPRHLKRDDRGRLHNEEGMAVQYSDGWGVYAWHGVLVPDYVVMLPEPVSFEMIAAEPNVEVRRVLIERFGLENYLRENRLIKIHQDKCGTLYRMDLSGDEPVLVVQVINSSPEPDGTYKEYFLRVPPNMVRARQAVAWTFGLTEEEYAPLVET